MQAIRWSICLALSLVAGLSATTAQAKPRVVVSIAPAHSLVAQVMDGVAVPELLLPGGASPHHFSLKPSGARTLYDADLVFWVGPMLEGWMVKPIAALPKNARVVALSEAEGLTRYALREGGVWEAHAHTEHTHTEHDHKEHADKDHGHTERGHHADHDHKHHEESGRAEESHTGHKGHDRHEAHHGSHADDFSVDPHFWLDPRNAAIWVEQIVRVLVERDPANAERYKANAVSALKDIEALEVEIAELLKPVRARPFIVFHDAYRQFEERFGLNAVGSIALPDGGTPGPARLAEIQQKLRERKAECVFTEPQLSPKLARMAVSGTGARTGELDPLGAKLDPGPGLYRALLGDLARSLRDCLGERSNAEER